LRHYIRNPKNMRLVAYQKYAFYIRKFGSSKKIKNLLLNRQELKKGRTVLTSFPYKVTFDPSSLCNLQCKGCHTGIKHPEMLKPQVLKFSDFKIMFDKIKDYVFSVSLYNWGEPFLNKDIFKMIAYATENNVGTTMHSNFNFFNEEMAEKLVRSGLTHLYLSIDGASQDTYSIYRINGDYNKVLKNVELLLRKKKELKKKFPIVTWKFLTFDHNRHEVNIAKERSHILGVNNFETFEANPVLMDLRDEAKKYSENPRLFDTLSEKCSSLWSSIYVGPDGTLFPCSLAFRKEESFGNLLISDFKDIWNNESYLNSRKLFTDPTNLSNVPMPCSTCKYFLRCKNKSR
jgi:radical SAM protein with 4Fe4S-binding SPASM domain